MAEHNTKSSLSPARIAWQRFKRNPVGIVSLYFIGLIFFIAIAGYLITSDQTPYANHQLLEISTQKPGFKVEMLKVRNNSLPSKKGFFTKIISGIKSDFTYYPLNNYQFTQDSIYVQVFEYEPDGNAKHLGFSLFEVCFPLDEAQAKSQSEGVSFTNRDGNIETISFKELKLRVEQDHLVSKRFYLGTDQFGRDLLSRLLIGARVSLSVGFISVFISLLIGISVGSIGGYFRGRTDDIVMWVINVIWSIPTLLLVIAITFALGKGFWQVFIAVGLTMWVEVARVVRGQMISIREKEFAEAAKALGYSDIRIILKHLLPNVMSPVIVISAANFASAILIEAGLSFLGLGVQPPVPSWGSMIKENYAYIILDSAYLAIMPGIAIMLLVLSFMLIGNALRDALDVRLKD